MHAVRNHLSGANMKNVIEQYSTITPPFIRLFWGKVFFTGFSNKWLCILLYNVIEVKVINGSLQWLAHKIKGCLEPAWQVFFLHSVLIHTLQWQRNIFRFP